MQKILMAKATALWLIENTKLTFQQIATFCGMHILQVETLANSDEHLIPVDPVLLGQLTKQEIQRCEGDAQATLVLTHRTEAPSKKKARYVSLANRKEIRNAVLWLVRNYPELRDVEITKLLPTTKPTVHSIRSGTYWDIKSLVPKNPILIGLCSEQALQDVLQSVQKKAQI